MLRQKNSFPAALHLCLTALALSLAALSSAPAFSQSSSQFGMGFQQQELSSADQKVGITRVKYFEFRADAMTRFQVVTSSTNNLKLTAHVELLRADGKWIVVLADNGSGTAIGTLLETGKYRLVIATADGGVGKFSFTPQLTLPDKNVIPLGLNQTGQITLASAQSGPTRGQSYQMRVMAGQRFKFVAQSDGFPISLLLQAAGKNEVQTVRGTGSRAEGEFTASANGQLVLFVASQTGATGRYTLKVEPLASNTGSAPTPPASLPKQTAPSAAAAVPTESNGGPIRMGQNLHGRLDANDPQFEPGFHYDQYLLDLKSGQRVSVMLGSSEFTPSILAIGPQGHFAPQRNAFTRGSLNVSQIEFTATADGIYKINATAKMPGTGAYMLSIEARRSLEAAA